MNESRRDVTATANTASLTRRITVPANTIKQRFAKKYTPEPMSGCWLWTGAVNGISGRSIYGRIRIQGKSVYAHRLSWSIHRGRIPSGKMVLHMCGVKQCVNPDHLYIGDASDNLYDAVRDGTHPSASKTHCAKGHEYTPENTRTVYRRNGGKLRPRRLCRVCWRKWQRRWARKRYAEKKAE